MRRSLLCSIALSAAALLAPAPAAIGQVDQTTAGKIVPASTESGQLLVPVEVHGQKAWMTLDTGATSSVVDARIAKALGLAPAGEAVTQTEFGCTSTAQPVAVTDWSVGGVALPPVTATAPRTVGPVTRWRGRPVIGLLGNDALAGFGTVAVDFLDKRVVLGGRVAPTGRTLEGTALVDRATGAVALFVARVTLRGRRAVFAVDTGATTSTIEARLAKRLKLRRGGEAVPVQAVSCSTKARPVLIPGWRSGKVNLPLEVALARDTGLRRLGLSGLLGASVLSSFGQVTFDYVGKRVLLGYPAPAGASLATGG